MATRAPRWSRYETRCASVSGPWPFAFWER